MHVASKSTSSLLACSVATANHYILDAVAGLACVGLAYATNGFLLNFLIVEDYLWGSSCTKSERKSYVRWTAFTSCTFTR